MLELDELNIIVAAVAGSSPINGWQARVEEILSGAALRGEQRQHSRARDIQFELLTAALWRNGGYDVAFDEPDVVVRSGEIALGIAAKRPRFIHTLDRNIKKARRQIDRSGRDGVIAIDMSCLVNPDDGHAVFDGIVPAEEYLTSLLNGFVEKNQGRIRKFACSSRVVGIIVQMALPVYVPIVPALGSVRRVTISNIMPLDDPRAQFLWDASERLSFGHTLG